MIPRDDDDTANSLSSDEQNADSSAAHAHTSRTVNRTSPVTAGLRFSEPPASRNVVFSHDTKFGDEEGAKSGKPRRSNRRRRRSDRRSRSRSPSRQHASDSATTSSSSSETDCSSEERSGRSRRRSEQSGRSRDHRRNAVSQPEVRSATVAAAPVSAPAHAVEMQAPAESQQPAAVRRLPQRRSRSRSRRASAASSSSLASASSSSGSGSSDESSDSGASQFIGDRCMIAPTAAELSQSPWASHAGLRSAAELHASSTSRSPSASSGRRETSVFRRRQAADDRKVNAAMCSVHGRALQSFNCDSHKLVCSQCAKG